MLKRERFRRAFIDRDITSATRLIYRFSMTFASSIDAMLGNLMAGQSILPAQELDFYWRHFRSFSQIFKHDAFSFAARAHARARHRTLYHGRQSKWDISLSPASLYDDIALFSSPCLLFTTHHCLGFISPLNTIRRPPTATPEHLRSFRLPSSLLSPRMMMLLDWYFRHFLTSFIGIIDRI